MVQYHTLWQVTVEITRKCKNRRYTPQKLFYKFSSKNLYTDTSYQRQNLSYYKSTDERIKRILFWTESLLNNRMNKNIQSISENMFYTQWIPLDWGEGRVQRKNFPVVELFYEGEDIATKCYLFVTSKQSTVDTLCHPGDISTFHLLLFAVFWYNPIQQWILVQFLCGTVYLGHIYATSQEWEGRIFQTQMPNWTSAKNVQANWIQ